MKEFCELTWDEPFFPEKMAKAVLSNTDGKIVAYSDSESILEDLMEILQNSGLSNKIADKSSGMEAILCRLFGVNGSYSSDDSFGEQGFVAGSKTLKFSKEFTVK